MGGDRWFTVEDLIKVLGFPTKQTQKETLMTKTALFRPISSWSISPHRLPIFFKIVNKKLHNLDKN